jgi:hypothetical protein
MTRRHLLSMVVNVVWFEVFGRLGACAYRRSCAG